MMNRIRHILFPVDFSERCTAIRPQVEAMVSKFEAKVTLLHVVQIPASFYPALDTAYVVDIDVNAMIAEAREKIKVFYGGEAEIAVEAGDPATIVTNYAADHDIDLIMLSTHGYGRYRGLLLGSVAAKVLHDAACPVWTAAHTADPAVVAGANCKSMLVAVDLQPGSADLLRNASELAGMFDAKLRMVHAVPGAGGDRDVYTRGIPDADFDHFLLQAAREEAMRVQDSADTRLELCIAGGSVAHVIRAAAEHHAADLVVIGRGKLHSPMGRLRTHAYSIIRDSPCPVLSL